MLSIIAIIHFIAFTDGIIELIIVFMCDFSLSLFPSFFLSMSVCVYLCVCVCVCLFVCLSISLFTPPLSHFLIYLSFHRHVRLALHIFRLKAERTRKLLSKRVYSTMPTMWRQCLVLPRCIGTNKNFALWTNIFPIAKCMKM